VKWLLVGIALYVTGLCQAAPAPIPKPIPKVEAKHLTGHEFQWNYGGHTGVYVLQPGGKFYCTLGTTRYYGTWTFKDDVLYTKETMDGTFYSQYDYTIKLTIDFRGRLLNKMTKGQCSSGVQVTFESPRKVK
jgi:hypothetical protein